MADAVGTVAVVEELAIFPPANRTLPTSAAAGTNLIVGLATLESVSFFLGKNVIGVQVTRFRCGLRGGASAGTGVCRLGVLFASPRQAKADG